jgi:nitrate reductase gamma subunit
MSLFFGVMLPYAAAAVFVVGMAYRVLMWMRSSVPFRIPTVSGQQRSLPWIRHSRWESPSTLIGVIVRMALEVLLFRSLFRNTRAGWGPGKRLIYTEEKWLWLGALLFHWSLLIILARHLRLFLEPTPQFVIGLQFMDGLFQVGSPVFYWTDAGILLGLTFLLLRRVLNRQLRYISLLTDYLALVLLLGLALTGVVMRYVTRIDLTDAKRLTLSLVSFSPHVPEEMSLVLIAHLCFLSALLAYFPFSQLMHMAGVFLSPTRNLANNNRMKRHVNDWDRPVKVHSYPEWEDDFREKMKAAGLPLERP